MKITIIGAGNMGTAIARGLLADNPEIAQKLTISDPATENLSTLKAINENITITSNNSAAAKDADIVILAVKPWLVDVVLPEIATMLTEKQIFISIAAGVDFEKLSSICGKFKKMPLFRVMPNTAIAQNESMTLIASKNASAEEERVVLQLFSSLGKAILIEEKLMGAATSVTSCGIAYALRYLRAAVEGAIELGFRADMAQEIVAQTMKGAIALVENGSHPEVEIDKVCTPGGWTIKGLNEMEAHGFSNAVIKGLKANNK